MLRDSLKPISEALSAIRKEQVIHRRFDQLVDMSHEVLQSVIAESPREIAEIVAKKIIQDHDHYSEHFRRLKQVVTKIQAMSQESHSVFIEALRTVLTQEQIDHAFDKYHASNGFRSSSLDALTNMLITCGVSLKTLFNAIEHYAIQYVAPYFNALLEKKSDTNFKEFLQKAVEKVFSQEAFFFENERVWDVKSPMVDSLIEKISGDTDILGCVLLHAVNKKPSYDRDRFKQDVVKKLIDAHASLAWTFNDTHHTALHCAVNFKNFDDNDLVILEMLLKAGFDASVRQSAANLAQQNNLSYVSALILNYEDNNIRNILLNYTGTYQLSTLNVIYHILRNEDKMLQSILKEENEAKRIDKFKEVVLALAKKNDFKTAMKLIEEASCPFVIKQERYSSSYYLYKSFQDEEGNTLLHYAAMHGNSDAIKKLLREGFDLTKVNNQGKTPAKLALENGYIYLARTLGDHSLDYSRRLRDDGMIQQANMAVAGHLTQIKQMADYYGSNRSYDRAMIFHCLAAIYSANQDEKLSYKKYIETLDINALFFLFNGAKKRSELQLLKDFLLNDCLQANTLGQLIEKHPDIEPLALILFIMKNRQASIDKQKEAQKRLEESIRSMMKEEMNLIEDEINQEMMRIQQVIAKIPVVPPLAATLINSLPSLETLEKIPVAFPVDSANIPAALTVSPTVPSAPPLLSQQENIASSRYNGTLFAGSDLTTRFIPGVSADLRTLEEKERRFTQH